MKKTLLVAAVVAASLFGFTSCTLLEKEMCYKVILTYSVNGESKTTEFYTWSSALQIASDVAEQRDKIQEQYDEIVTVSSKSSGQSQYTTKEDCEAQNEERNNK